jgi:O-antigen ligase
MSTSDRLERTAAWLLMAAVALVSFKLLPAQVAFGLAAILWLRIVATEPRDRLPAFVWPLAGYLGWTVLSAIFSVEPATSLLDLRQLVLFLIVPMTLRLLRGSRAMTTLDVIIATGSAAALVAVVQSQVFGFDNLNNRPAGSLSHYMTYSGVIMLILCAAVARLLFYTGTRVWPGVAIPALVVALAVTLTRNAYIGAAVAIVCLIALRNPKLLLAVPALALVTALAAPDIVRDRARSAVDLDDPSNKDRIQMLAMGVDMVRDHPVFGVGPDMVGVVYEQYLRPDPVHTYNPHLHNVPMQIAAERGLPALALWVTFIVLLLRDLLRLAQTSEVRAVAASGLGATIAMLTAGLFEYNFGDSEFLMLLLCLITLPFAAVRRT